MSNCTTKCMLTKNKISIYSVYADQRSDIVREIAVDENNGQPVRTIHSYPGDELIS